MGSRATFIRRGGDAPVGSPGNPAVSGVACGGLMAAPRVGGGRDVELKGRRREGAVFDALLAGMRGGKSGVLVVRGEAGVGKTALLEYAVESASDVRVLRAVGVQSEMEVAFAALHQLCAPMLGRLEELP